MKGQLSIITVAAVVFFVLIVLVFFGNVSGRFEPPESDVQVQEKACELNDDCLTNPDGTVCLDIYQPGKSLGHFCGCLYDDNCTEGVCIDNICS